MNHSKWPNRLIGEKMIFNLEVEMLPENLKIKNFATVTVMIKARQRAGFRAGFRVKNLKIRALNPGIPVRVGFQPEFQIQAGFRVQN